MMMRLALGSTWSGGDALALAATLPVDSVAPRLPGLMFASDGKESPRFAKQKKSISQPICSATISSNFDPSWAKKSIIWIKNP